ncbi:MiaB/RimO family radical SAM methylthiotransferase [Candidatus Beckwithbacteria bacterium]|nr:MiaB/RimO family radical SAM methylthiotransferase [Candidatus Beckwithbacteria bacterium]
MKKTYFIKTWGCQMNQADSERLAGYYESQGFIQAKKINEADLLILVTCSVRQSAENRVGGLLQKFKKEFNSPKNKKPKIILTGCMTHYGEQKLKKKFPLLDEILAIDDLKLQWPYLRKHQKQALVPISTGCNSFCTYCIVPFSRGREKSRPQAEIIEEIKKLTEKGYEEFTLLGQNVNSYGLEKIGMHARKILDTNKELPTPQSQYKSFVGLPPFVKLLDKICAIEKVKKVNFISSNPWDFYNELIDCLVRNPKINREIHLAMQSGDDEILQKMNRGYTAKQYLSLINQIRQKVKGASFTTDIIVGFPTETEEQFQNTVKLCQKIKFNLAYINRYSPRPGTVSSKIYKDDVHDLEKKRRWKILNDLINKN